MVRGVELVGRPRSILIDGNGYPNRVGGRRVQQLTTGYGSQRRDRDRQDGAKSNMRLHADAAV